MRTILLGSDFNKNKDGVLKPIEINTAVTFDGEYIVEDFEDVFDLTDLVSFIQTKNFTKVYYIGEMGKEFGIVLEAKLNEINIAYEHLKVSTNSITIPFIEDSDDILIIRSAYDTTAIVDEEYCKNKIGFLNLIKDSSFGSQFVYIDNADNVVSNITSIPDNGVHPNFILKAVLPQYDEELYPKLFKVSNQTELDAVIAANVTRDYFLMEFNIDTNSLLEDHLVMYRTLNLLFPPNLESIKLGAYTKASQFKLPVNPTYNETTFEIDEEFKFSYIIGKKRFDGLPKLEDTDLVELADGTFKTALDLQIGDELKTIDIDTNGQIVSPVDEEANFNITFDALQSGSSYSTNVVLGKQYVSTYCVKTFLTFADGTDWEDMGSSSYLVLRNNEVRFVRIEDLEIGDEVILIDSSNNELNFVKKTVANKTRAKGFFDGWYISVSRTHYFLTKTGSDSNQSYVAIEHNIGCQSKGCPPYQPGWVNGCCPTSQCCKTQNLCQYYCA